MPKGKVRKDAEAAVVAIRQLEADGKDASGFRELLNRLNEQLQHEDDGEVRV